MLTVAKVVKGKQGFYEVDLSDGETLRVSEDLLVKFRLLKGTELAEKDVEKIKKNASYDFGVQLALNYISYQLRSEKEVRSYLKEREIPNSDQEKIIRHLKDLSVLDDKVYGESYVRTQMRLSDKGPSVLKQQLRQKGLKPELIENVLELYKDKEQVEIAKRTAEKILKKIHNKSFKETKQKLLVSLRQKGFSGDVASQVLDSLELEADKETEIQALKKAGEKLWRRHQNKAPHIRNQKVKQSLYQKGFALEEIQHFIDEQTK
ncbi:regulatory protein RecX [Enterococcus saigonensis]|uniref:Regulatory protein RecX n=1 Tax=Enterococcus saigonensis TaxID=1805431 RepID=A0A679IQT6_9ENTE|nr:recombination regulator RecX [Enterococcus saigonensis]BCA85557.1 regulatory protein RecX [Enterococcus saigonensis]